MNARCIMDREGKSLYLRRWYILGEPWMEDGSQAWDEYGTLKKGAKESFWTRVFGIALYLHCIHQSDSEPELHNHPWRWCLSFILRGGYLEERRIERPWGWGVVRRIVRPFTFNFIRSTDFHRVELLDGVSWSLFLVGPRFKGWGFWDRVFGRFLPHDIFIARRRRS